jgi:hypothetical protein
MTELPASLRSLIQEADATIRLHFPWWLRRVTSRDVVAITLGGRVYVRADAVLSNLEAVVRHELVHVSQVRRLGLIRFYWSYLAEYIRHRRAGMSSSQAYSNISFEREAVAAEERGTVIPSREDGEGSRARSDAVSSTVTQRAGGKGGDMVQGIPHRAPPLASTQPPRGFAGSE